MHRLTVSVWFIGMLEKLKMTIEHAKVLEELDELVLNALFAPAEDAGIFDDEDISSWRDPSRRNRADSLLDQLLTLSEFYQEINPPLSSALWGIWNSVKYFRGQSSFLNAITESKKSNNRVFVGIRALVATAAVQFSDGTASTVATSDAMENLSIYRKRVEEAIFNLSAARPKDF